MANLHRYLVRAQMKRVVVLDAQNAAHAKSLAELDVAQMDDSEKIQAQNATLIQENTGVSSNGSITLNRYAVNVRFRRNIALDALDLNDARYWAEQDQGGWDDTEAGSVQAQHIILMQHNTGVS